MRTTDRTLPTTVCGPADVRQISRGSRGLVSFEVSKFNVIFWHAFESILYCLSSHLSLFSSSFYSHCHVNLDMSSYLNLECPLQFLAYIHRSPQCSCIIQHDRLSICEWLAHFNLINISCLKQLYSIKRLLHCLIKILSGLGDDLGLW